MLDGSSLDAAIAELLQLEKSIDEYSDDPSGPWVYDDGTPFTGAGKGKCKAAPARHPRRCHSESRWSGRRCKRWACQGRDYCPFHRGRAALRCPNKPMPSLYSKLLMPTLQVRLQEFLGSKTRQEQLETYEEIGLARTFLSQQIELLTLAESKGEAIDPDTVMSLRRLCRDGLTHVSELCSRAARIEKDLSDKVSVEALGMFVEDIARLINRRLGESDLAVQPIDDMRTKLRLPGPAGGDETVRVVGVDLED